MSLFLNSQTALALVEGFGLAFSPCILPILPFILAASTVGGRTRPFLIIGGFVVSFTAFALVSRRILAATGVQQDTIQYVAFGLLLLFGLTMVVPFLEEWFARLTGSLASGAERVSGGKRAEGPLGALLVGALIGVVWTPCAGPILAAVLLQVIQAQTNLAATTTMLAFSIGAGIPMLAIALFGQQVTRRVRGLSKHTTLIRRGMGIVIIIFALCGLLGFNLGAWAVSSSSPALSVAANAPATAKLTGTQAAPEITGITQWFNGPPLTIAQLKGKVVLVDFWTYSCINCIRTLPYIEGWYEKYKDQGFVVIGVHAPEFPFEGKPANVAAGIRKFGLTYPVAMDNDFATWKAYDNKYWPAHYLINRDGKIVETHGGEGGYAETENNIRALLGLSAQAVTPDKPVFDADQTPETYLGYDRADHFTGRAVHDAAQSYQFPAHLPRDRWALQGSWTVAHDRIEANSAGSALRLNFKAGKVYLVLGSKTGAPVTATLTLDGKPIGDNAGKDAKDGTVTINQHRLYELVSQPAAGPAMLEINASGPGLDAYAFTFGN